MRNAQKEAWEEVCRKYAIEKAEYERCCEEMRRTGTKVRDLPQKPKRHLQKDVFNEAREKWVRDLETDKDQMEVDEDFESEFGDRLVASPSRNGGGVGSGWGSSGEDEAGEDGDEDIMDVDEL